MWFIFLVTCVVVALATLLVIWVGNEVILSMKRRNRRFEEEERKNNES